MSKRLIVISVIIVAVSIIITVGSSQLQATKYRPMAVEGYLEPVVSVEIRSKVSGEIEQIFVDEGDVVEKGQELLKINAEEIIEAYEQAKAGYEAAQANLNLIIKRNTLELDELHSEIERHRLYLKASQADLTYTQAESLMEIARSETDLKRDQFDLVAQKARSLQWITEREADLARGKSDLKQDKIALNQTQVRVEQTKLSTEPALIELQNAEAELNRKQNLHQEKYLSDKNLEETRKIYTAAKSTYESIPKEIQQAESEVQTRQESVRESEGNIQFAEKELGFRKQAEAAQIKRTEAQVQKAEYELALRQPFNAAKITRRAIEIETSQARLQWLEDKEILEKQVDELEVAHAHAQLQQAKSRLNEVQKRLEYTTIRAPMSGTVTRRVVEVGTVIAAYSDTMIEFADLSQMRVRAYLNESDIDRVEIGQNAVIKVSAYPKQTFTGKVTNIFPRGDFRDEINAVAVDKEYVWCATTRYRLICLPPGTEERKMHFYGWSGRNS